MKKNNYPQGALDEIEPSAVQELVTSLKELHDKGKPKTDREIKERIEEYFTFCQHSSIRPGIESLCMILHIGRTCLYNWGNGVGCSKECQELIQSAKAFIAAYIEQAMLSSKISPPSGIFLMKNWLSYKDAISLEESVPDKPMKPIMAMDELPVLGEPGKHSADKLPVLGDSEDHDVVPLPCLGDLAENDNEYESEEI